MAPHRKLENPTTLFAQVEERQYQGIKGIALAESKSLAEVVREALTLYLDAKAFKEQTD